MYHKTMKIGIYYKKDKIKDDTVVTHLQGGFLRHGVKAEVLSSYADIAGKDFVIVLGGDGALLHAALEAARSNVKIVGVNYGTLGFLTEYESADTDEVISLILEGKYTVLKRTILEVTCKGVTSYALNEVSLQRDALAPAVKQLVSFETKIDGKEVENVLSDGIIVSTPTGSTAYSLAAGGCILTPEVPVFLLTPLNAFSWKTRPVVFSDEKEVKILLPRERDKAHLFCDGKHVGSVGSGDEIVVRKASFTADFLQGEYSDFFYRLRTKIRN